MGLIPDHAGKVHLYDRITGQRLDRWPVDARELLATGGYTTDPINTASADSVPVTSVAELLAPETPDTPVPASSKARRRRPVASES
jgi:hypothetical protein